MSEILRNFFYTKLPNLTKNYFTIYLRDLKLTSNKTSKILFDSIEKAKKVCFNIIFFFILFSFANTRNSVEISILKSRLYKTLKVTMPNLQYSFNLLTSEVLKDASSTEKGNTSTPSSTFLLS